jgi:CubicO group peptidase (beta-lactamase class C family)
MGHSTLLMTDVDSSELAWGHQLQHDSMRPTAAYPYNRPHAGSSTLHSDVHDMLRWAQANLQHGHLEGGRILPASAYAWLWAQTRDITPVMRGLYQQYHLDFAYDSCGIALAWFICSRQGHRLVWHDGDDRGFESSLVLEPDNDAAVVVMANADGVNLGRLALQLVDLVNVSEGQTR